MEQKQLVGSIIELKKTCQEVLNNYKEIYNKVEELIKLNKKEN